WPRTSQEPPFLGSFAVADINRQGTKSPIGVDESCHMQRYTALGKRVQCQWVAQNVISSAAAVIHRETQVDPPLSTTGLIPNEVGAGLNLGSPVSGFNSYGHSLACFDQPAPDLLFTKAGTGYTSSPAAARLTDTRVQDIVIQSETNKIQVFLGRTT